MEMPLLETARLVIRRFTPGDLDSLYRIIDCDCFGKRSPDDNAAKSRRKEWLDWNLLGYEQQARLGHPPYGERAIMLNGDRRLIGVCGLVPSFGPFRRLLDGDQCDLNSPELGLFYAVATEYRQQGYATEAAAALIQFAFQTLRVRRIVATTELEKEASLRVMRRLGMAIHRDQLSRQVVGCRENLLKG
jgi:[ribosomal protein S5]-alanine N-acetyltransferase